MYNIYIIDLIFQKIRLTDILAKLWKKFSNILKKIFIHLSLDNKRVKKLQLGLIKFINLINFTLYKSISSYYKLLNLNKVNWLKNGKQIIWVRLLNIRVFYKKTNLLDFIIYSIMKCFLEKSLLLLKKCWHLNFISIQSANLIILSLFIDIEKIVINLNKKVTKKKNNIEKKKYKIFCLHLCLLLFLFLLLLLYLLLLLFLGFLLLFFSKIIYF